MKKYYINFFDFGIISVSDVEVSETDFFRILTAISENYDVYCCDNPKESHYFFNDYYGCLNCFCYVRGCDCE